MQVCFLSNVNTGYGHCARKLTAVRTEFVTRNPRNFIAAQSSFTTQSLVGRIPIQKSCILLSRFKKNFTASSYSCPVTSRCLTEIPPRSMPSSVVQLKSRMASSSTQSVTRVIGSGRRALSCGKPVGISFRGGVYSHRKACGSLQHHLAAGIFFTYLALDNRPPCALLAAPLETSAAFSSRCYSNGAAPDVHLVNEQLADSAALPAQESTRLVTLKLNSGSYYLPHPDKEKTGGEDAHFICEDERVIGVADGVGGWAEVGIDAGEYARQLMSNSVASIKNDTRASINPLTILEEAYAATKAQGSSTACIIALTDQGIHATNLGDSGFVVIRDGSIVFQSTPQQYGFNFPYQLGNDSGADVPSSSQVIEFAVKAGDVIVAGTDGLFDNLYSSEICAIVVDAIRAHLEPQVTAQKIAVVAQERARDQYKQTPFSASAQEAGFRYYGGKLDDITVVVSYVTCSN